MISNTDVCGSYYGYVAVIKSMWRLYWYVAVILVCGGYIGIWRLYRTTALLELLWAAKKNGGQYNARGILKHIVQCLVPGERKCKGVS